MELALTGRRLEACEAHTLGLINQLVDADHLITETDKLVELLCGHSILSLRHTKQLLRFSLDHDMSTQSEQELDAFGQCVANDDFVEGVKAFIEKREPNFKNLA